ncbi:MAG: putative transport system permease protein [Acetobacteraceae bacterium]|nr:putative transport system permease protein [Acetobacteraceae bacterium]
MLFAALRDMQWRKRRLVIAIVSTGLIFGMTLVMSGLANGFRVEARNTVDSLGVDAFVVKDGAAGPFMGSTPFPDVDLARVRAVAGVTAAAPLGCVGTIMKDGSSTRNVTAFGAPEHGPGMPQVSEGRAPARPDEVAASSVLGRHLGDTLQIGTHILRIVGIVPNSTALAKIPNIFLTTEGLQQVAYNGQPMITSIGINGTPRALPDGYRTYDRTGAVNDLIRPLKVAVTSITIVALLLWVVAVLIVGSVVYLSALERVRDFAVFKAIGTSSRSILGGLALQALVVSLFAAAVGVVLSMLLAPLFPMVVAVPLQAYVLLPVVAVAIGLLASLAGLRRVVAIDPALAFGGP